VPGFVELFEVGHLDTPGSANGVVVVDGLACVADDAVGLRVIDVSDPATAEQVAILGTPSFTLDVFLAGEFAYVADSFSGLRVVQVVAEPGLLLGRLAAGMALLAVCRRRGRGMRPTRSGGRRAGPRVP